MSKNKKKPPVTLVGQNGNAFVVMGLCQRASKKAGWSTEEWKKVQDEMMSGNYDHLLQTAMRHFNVDGMDDDIEEGDTVPYHEIEEAPTLRQSRPDLDLDEED